MYYVIMCCDFWWHGMSLIKCKHVARLELLQDEADCSAEQARTTSASASKSRTWAAVSVTLTIIKPFVLDVLNAVCWTILLTR